MKRENKNNKTNKFVIIHTPRGNLVFTTISKYIEMVNFLTQDISVSKLLADGVILDKSKLN